MNQGRQPATVCPRCAATLDAWTAIDPKARPKPGDLSLCGYCALPLRFDERLGLVELTDADVAVLDPETLDMLNEARSALLRFQVYGRTPRGHREST